MRPIQWLVVHCTATPQNTTVASILNYWRTQLGWKNPGYHIVIEPNSKSHRLLPDATPSNGVADHIAHVLHVSHVGGIDAHNRGLDTRTPAQKAELLRISSTGNNSTPTPAFRATGTFPMSTNSASASTPRPNTLPFNSLFCHVKTLHHLRRLGGQQPPHLPSLSALGLGGLRRRVTRVLPRVDRHPQGLDD